MDKFGQGRVKRGPPGPPGKDALNLFVWCPESLLTMFRESESCTYFFNTAGDGILPKPLGLKDRYGKKHAICIKNFEKPQKYENIFMLPLKGALYRIDNILLALTPPSIAIFALTFKIGKALTGTHYIFSNQSKTRGITISETLNICGADPLLLEYYKDDWNRLIVQYSNNGPCFFMLNGRKGFFIKQSEEIEENILFIGGHPDEKRPANVYITNFEIYGRGYQEKTPGLLPDEILTLIERNYVDRIG